MIHTTQSRFLHLAITLGLLAVTRPCMAQFNTDGYVVFSGWSVLYPLTQRQGCEGGGLAEISRTHWTAPLDIGTESPTAGKEWSIDFSTAATDAWGGTAISPRPTWWSLAFLSNRIDDVTSLDGPVVDFQALGDLIALRTGRTVPRDDVLGLAVTYVRNTTGAELNVGLCISSDDSVAVYLNNHRVLARSVCRPADFQCDDFVPAVLPPGVSKIAALVWEGGGEHALLFRMFDSRGQLLVDGNQRVEFLGADDPDLVGQVSAETERVIDASDPDCSIEADCTDAARVSVTATTPGGRAGDPADRVVIEETIRPVTGRARSLDVLSTSPEAEVSELTAPSSGRALCFFPEITTVGEDVGGGSSVVVDTGDSPDDPSDDVYTSVSTTARDIWTEGDHFSFAYEVVEGDFDVAVEILESSHDSGVGRWGKFGLMARVHEDNCARFSMIQDHLPDLSDPLRFARRSVGEICDSVEEFVGPGGTYTHPRFQRLTRRDNIVTGWVSNRRGLEDGSLDPCVDDHWVELFSDSWDEAPAALLVGFANSEHTSNGPAEQTVRFRPLCACTGVDTAVGVRIRWEITRAEAEAGVEYEFCSQDPASYSIDGMIRDGGAPTPTDGDGAVHFAARGIGEWATAEDIGDVTALGSTSFRFGEYTQDAQGADVWQEGDGLHFAYRPYAGDVRVTARITEREHPGHGSRWGRAGLMARYDCAPDSAFHYSHSSLASNWGPDPFDPVTNHSSPPPPSAEYRQPSSRSWIRACSRRDGDMPSWVRLERRGNSIYHFVGDGIGAPPTSWTLLGTTSDRLMPDEILLGMAVLSHSGVHPQRSATTSSRSSRCGPPCWSAIAGRRVSRSETRSMEAPLSTARSS